MQTRYEIQFERDGQLDSMAITLDAKLDGYTDRALKAMNEALVTVALRLLATDRSYINSAVKTSPLPEDRTAWAQQEFNPDFGPANF